MSLSPTVRAGWCAFTARFEGRVAWPYLDDHRDAAGELDPIVTVGLGCALFTEEAFAALPWLGILGESVTADDARQAWAFLRTMTGGEVAHVYAYPGHLHLADDAIDALALQRLDANAVAVAAQLPELYDWPPEVQQACMSMSWALGASWPAHWPKLVAALRAGDWQAAADECRISEAGNPGVRARNDAMQAMLRGIS